MKTNKATFSEYSVGTTLSIDDLKRGIESYRTTKFPIRSTTACFQHKRELSEDEKNYVREIAKGYGFQHVKFIVTKKL